MKKIKFLFIILFLFMFIGIEQVDAAKEMYCVYVDKDESSDLGHAAPALLLLQDKSGNRYVYGIEYNKVQSYFDYAKAEETEEEILLKYFSYDSLNWRDILNENGVSVFNNAANDLKLMSSNTGLDQDGNLKECPSLYTFIYKPTNLAEVYDSVLFASWHPYYNSSYDQGRYEVELVETLSNDENYVGNRAIDEFLFYEIYDQDDYVINENTYSMDIFEKQYLVETKSGVDRTCLYTNYSKINGEYGFGSIQIDIDVDAKKFYIASAYVRNSKFITLTTDDYLDTDFRYLSVENNFDDTCPLQVFAQFGKTDDNVLFYLDTKRNSQKGRSTFDYTLASSMSSVVVVDPIVIEKCEDILGVELVGMLNSGVDIIKLLVPIILLVMGIVDFVQATFSSKEDDIKKVTSRFIKRVIVAVIIFLIPSALKLLLTLANAIWGNIDSTLCGIL